MKKRRKSAFGALILFFIILYSFSGCQETDAQREKIAGKWEHNGFIYEFRENGKLLYNGDEYRYDFPESDTIRILRGGETLLLSYGETEEGIEINGVPMFRLAEEDKDLFSSAAALIDRLGKSIAELMSDENA